MQGFAICISKCLLSIEISWVVVKVGRKDGGPMPGEDEPLHAYVTASNPESVKKAVDKVLYSMFIVSCSSLC